MPVPSRHGVRVHTDIRVHTEDTTISNSYRALMAVHGDEVNRLTRRVFIGTGITALATAPIIAACSDSKSATSTSSTPARPQKLSATPVAPFARSQHASALLSGGLVLVIGGMGASGALASCQVYDPGDGTWIDAAPLARARGLLSATATKTGHVLCLGGFDGNNAFGVGSVFDPEADRWEPTKPLTTPRYHHAAQSLDDGRVIVTGGFNVGPLSVPEIYEL